MKNRNRRIALISVLLVISIGNFLRISSGMATIRTVDFLSIIAIGALAGLLIAVLVASCKKQ